VTPHVTSAMVAAACLLVAAALLLAAYTLAPVGTR
jgi:hypothetical protein